MKLIKIPAINGLGKTDGCEKAPDMIVENVKQFYLNEDGMLPIFDVEDVEVNKSNIEETNNNISNKIKNSLENTDKCFALGGDHSITYACFKAFSEKNENAGLLVFDAHADLMHNFKPPTHEDYLRVLMEDKLVKKENVVLVGLRNWHKDEYNFLKQNKMKYFNMKEISFETLFEVSDAVMSSIKNFNALYISIDIDVLDPSFAPGTGYREPGGLTSRELLFFLGRLKLLKNLRMVDLVEVNPDKDLDGMTVKLGAKIITELF